MDYSVSEIREKLKKSEAYRDKYLKNRATRNQRWYNGNYKATSGLLTKDNVDYSELDYNVNLVYSTSRTIVSSIYSRFPEFSFFLRGDISKKILEEYGHQVEFQTNKLERFLEYVTKIYFSEMQARRTNRLAITDAVLMGFGCTKLGYNIDLDSDIYDKLKDAQLMEPEKYVELASNIEVSDLVKNSEPYLLRVHPMNMLFPPDATALNRISWQAEIIYKDVNEVMDEYDVKGLRPTYIEEWADNRDGSKKPNMIKLYEYHSLDPEFPFICVIADGYDKFLVKKQHPLFNEKTGSIKNMYQYIWFNECYDSLYPMSDIDLVAPQIREANIQVEKRVEHVRKFVRMYLLKGIFSENEKLKLITGADGTYIESMDGNADVQPIPNADLSPDFYNNINMIRNEIYETLGLTDYSSSVNTQQRKATEAQLVERSRVDRVQERVDIIEEFAYQQVDTFIEIMKEYQLVARMFNMQLNDERISMLFAGELLKMADIEIQVVPGSTISLDRDAQIRRFERVSAVLINANMAQPGLAKIGAFFKDQLSAMGYNGDEYINEEAPMLPPNMLQNVPALPGQQNQPGVPTQTPMQNANIPNTMGLLNG